RANGDGPWPGRSRSNRHWTPSNAPRRVVSVVGRRSFLFALSLAACSRRERDPTPLPSKELPSSKSNPPVSSTATVLGAPEPLEGGAGPRGHVKTETWTLDGDGRAFVIVPTWVTPDVRLPMLLALHGRGEANKGPALGVMGWPKDYALLRAIERVCAPALTTTDFEGFVEGKRLSGHNEALAKRPFAGLVIVCPYSPDVDLRKPAQIRDYSSYVMNTVLP